MIRPSVESLKKKRALMADIDSEWLDVCDYILYIVFDQPIVRMLDVKTAGNSNALPDYVFKESTFRYNVAPNTHHYVLWFAQYNFEYGLEKYNVGNINSILTKELEILTKNSKFFNFVWYINPKPSVTDFFHVQVFWIADTS
jgi:hypothetical protein